MIRFWKWWDKRKVLSLANAIIIICKKTTFNTNVNLIIGQLIKSVGLCMKIQRSKWICTNLSRNFDLVVQMSKYGYKWESDITWKNLCNHWQIEWLENSGRLIERSIGRLIGVVLHMKLILIIRPCKLLIRSKTM